MGMRGQEGRVEARKRIIGWRKGGSEAGVAGKKKRKGRVCVSDEHSGKN